MKHGFLRVATAQPLLKVADCQYNAEQIVNQIAQCIELGVDVVLFPELSMTAGSCGELLYATPLLNGAIRELDTIAKATKNSNIIAIVGLPIRSGVEICSSAAVIHNGALVGIASGANCIFSTQNFKFGIEIGGSANGVVPVSTVMAANGADVVFGMDSSPALVGSFKSKCSAIKEQSKRLSLGYVYSNSGFGESTTSYAYIASSVICDGGNMLCSKVAHEIEPMLQISEIDIEGLRYKRLVNSENWASAEALQGGVTEIEIDTCWSDDFELTRKFAINPFIPADNGCANAMCQEIFEIQIAALAKRFVHTNSKSAVIGISGGLDSTLALLVVVKTFDRLGYDRKGIVGITMPGFGTTDRTYNNAQYLMESLGITVKEISIKDACIQHFKDINHPLDVHNVTYENGQARERTQILMDYANMCGGMVIGTGDMSELALGWATFNGDHMSMYGVNAGVPKTVVKRLVQWVAQCEMDEASSKILLDIVDTPISPELIPADESGNIKQKTEDLVGPYELHDFFMYHFVGNGYAPDKIYDIAKIVFDGVYSKDVIYKWLKTFFGRFFAQQFKRNCLPDGPRIGQVALSSSIPSDACSAEWMRIINDMEV